MRGEVADVQSDSRPKRAWKPVLETIVQPVQSRLNTCLPCACMGIGHCGILPGLFNRSPGFSFPPEPVVCRCTVSKTNGLQMSPASKRRVNARGRAPRATNQILRAGCLPELGLKNGTRELYYRNRVMGGRGDLTSRPLPSPLTGSVGCAVFGPSDTATESIADVCGQTRRFAFRPGSGWR